MSFSYSGDPSSSPLDYIRFITEDTAEANAILTDEEINWIVKNAADVNRQLAIAFRQCATHYAKLPTDRKLGPQSENTKDRLTYFKAEARKYEKALTYAGVPPLPAYSAEKVFGTNMMANEES